MFPDRYSGNFMRWLLAILILGGCGGGGGSAPRDETPPPPPPPAPAPIAGTFSVSGPTTIGEDAGMAAYMVSLSAQPGANVTVMYATADGTATAGSDYTAASGTLTFTTTNWSTAQTVDVVITDDAVDEDDETFTFTLSGASSGSQLSDTPSVTTTIIDNDDPPPTIADVNLELLGGVLELHEWDTSSEAELGISLSEPVDGDVVVALDSTGSAILGGDFELLPDEVSIAQGSSSATARIVPIRDFEAEGSETVIIEVGAVTGNGQAGTQVSTSLEILDQGALFTGAKERVYGKLYAFFGDPIIYDDRVDIIFRVYNFRAATTSPTSGVLVVSRNEDFSSSNIFRSFDIPSLMPGAPSFELSETIALNRLRTGATHYALVDVNSAPGEAPGARRARDFGGIVTNSNGTVRVRCPYWQRDQFPGTEDPLRKAQWNLQNTGQTAYAARGGVAMEDLGMQQTLDDGPTGSGVRVAVVDTGLEICHPDLEANVEARASFNFNGPFWHGVQAIDPFHVGTFGDHGTSVAGIIGAQANNGIGLRGVAPSVMLRGYNFLSRRLLNVYYDSLGASTHSPNSSDVDIFNMSFGGLGFEDNTDPDEVNLFRFGVTQLRGGRGALYVKAAGNGFERCDSLRRVDEVRVGESDDDGDGTPEPRLESYDLNDDIGCVSANASPSQNLPYLISIGAFSANGERSSYSSVGSALWASAPSGQNGISVPAQITTDQMGAAQGYDALFSGFFGVSPRIPTGGDENPHGDYINSFNGTSAAAPNASGAIALLLEAQPELTWRDVKYILARTARQIHADIPELEVGFGGTGTVLRHGWITNAAGYRFHNWYGFGAIAVDDAVALARTHVPNSLGRFSDGEQRFEHRMPASIPDHDGAGVRQTLDVAGIDEALKVEAVQLHIEVTHPFTNDLGVYLVSPSGTESLLNPPFNEVLVGDVDLDWTLMSNAFYGESPLGDWTIKVVDAAEGDVGTLESWALTFYLGEIPPRL